MQPTKHNICTLILAGGRGRRMQNQDKGLVMWQGKTLIEHVLSHTQNDCVMISANRNIAHYQTYGHPVIEDKLDNFQGPLAGLLAAMQYTNKDYILTLPCDSPQPPDNLQQFLINAMQQTNKQCAISDDGQRRQPLFSLIATQYKNDLNTFLKQGHRKVGDFFHSLNPAVCDFSAQAERFNNFNRAEDLL